MSTDAAAQEKLPELTNEEQDAIVRQMQQDPKLRMIYLLILWSSRIYAVARRMLHRYLIDPTRVEILSDTAVKQRMAFIAEAALHAGAKPFSTAELVDQLKHQLIGALEAEHRLLSQEWQDRVNRQVGDLKKYLSERPLQAQWVDIPRDQHQIWTGKTTTVANIVRSAVLALTTAPPDPKLEEPYTVLYFTNGEAAGLPAMSNLLVCSPPQWHQLEKSEQKLDLLLKAAANRFGRPIDVVVIDHLPDLAKDKTKPGLHRLNRASKHHGFSILAGYGTGALEGGSVPAPVEAALSNVAKFTPLLLGQPETGGQPVSIGFNGPTVVIPGSHSGLIL